jgi:hypothetical protein
VILSDADLVTLTHRARPSAQARVLRLMGIPFKVHPVDGGLQVARSAADAYLGAATAANDDGDHYEIREPVGGQKKKQRRSA